MREKDFDSTFQKAYEEKSPNFEEHINVAVVGKVSSGKSSLLNAILGRDRSDPIATVGAQSGVTTKVTAYRLDKHVLIMDCPGLDDVRKENSEETENFLHSIDLGLFVVTGSSDSSQKANYDDLKKNCKKIIVVLNKIDEWDKLEESEYEAVVTQWKKDLGTDNIFGTCTTGYDPKMRKNFPMDLRGVDEVREEIFGFLEKEGKAILLARHLKNREKYAYGIIGTALMAVAAEAFIPGSAAYITATQVVAISSLHYLYTGEILSKSASLALLPTFAGQSAGTTAFLWAKSFFPPTGILDVIAAGIAVAITFAMLASVKLVLEKGFSLDRADLLAKAFEAFKAAADELKKVSPSDMKNSAALGALLARIFQKGSSAI